MRFLKGFKGNPNREPENPQLVRTMKALAIGDNPNTRKKFYTELLRSTLLLPTAQEMEDIEVGQTTLQRATSASIVVGQTETGKPILMAFTDPEALRLWDPDNRYYMGLQGDELMNIAAYNHFEMLVINPAGPTGGEVTAAEIKLLAEGKMPEVAHKVERSELAGAIEVKLLPPQPDQMPSDAIQRQMGEAFAQFPEVALAYTFLFEAPPQPMILATGLVFDPQTSPQRVDSIMRQIISQVTGLMQYGQEMNFLILNDELHGYVQQTVPPLYDRDGMA